MGKMTGKTPQQLETFCGHWPGITRDIKWETNLVLSVGGKMFAMMPTDGERLSCKADARFRELTDQPFIVPVPHLARAHWISITEPQRFTAAQLRAFIHDAYGLVRRRLPRKAQVQLATFSTLEAEKE